MTSTYFDDWYDDIHRSDAKDPLFSEALGVPVEVGPSDLVPIDGLTELAALLSGARDGCLVDLACGRGGPGMWLAREVGVRELVGVDFSPRAVALATERRSLFELVDRARYVVGDLVATGLDDAVATAVVCLDAFQFASDPVAAGRELRRVLRPGGAVALTSWEAVIPGDERVSERLRFLDIAGALAAAGLVDVVRRERPEWYALDKALMDRVIDLEPSDDPAIESWRHEAERSLPTYGLLARVLVTAHAPA